MSSRLRPELGGLGLERAEQLVEALLEAGDTFAFERVGDVVEIDADVGEVRPDRLGLVEIGIDAPGEVPWSANASIVASGRVLTVSGPISSSTYSVSGYAGFLVDVLAHSGRCTTAPARQAPPTEGR